MKLSKKIKNKLFLNYFNFKIQKRTEDVLQSFEIQEITKWIYFHLINSNDDDKIEIKKTILQYFYMLVELGEIENDVFYSHIKLFIGDYAFFSNHLYNKKIDLINEDFLKQEIEKNRIEDYFLFEGQREVYQKLSSKVGSFLINAPTSFGKTQLVIKSLAKDACIIVPTIALLNEISQIIRNTTEFKVITNSMSSVQNKDETIFIFTQEKLLGFSSNNPNYKFSKVIVDEAYNMLTNDSRGFLLTSIVKDLYSKNIQIYLITPNSNKNIFKTIFPEINNFEFIDMERYFQTERIIFLVSTNEVHYFDLIDEMWHKLINFSNEDIDINYINNKLNQKPIIYTSKSDMENVAKYLKNEVKKRKNDFLISYTKKYIWEKYKTIDFSEKGILIHNGSLDNISKIIIEDIFKNSDEYTLVANSTILSGVNLNTKNMIINNLRTNGSKTSLAALKNLLGRVGRYSITEESYLGTVFIIKKTKPAIIKKAVIKSELNLEDFKVNTNEKLQEEINKTDDYGIKLAKNSFKIFNENGDKSFMTIYISDKQKYFFQIERNSKKILEILKEGISKGENSKILIDIFSHIFSWDIDDPFTGNNNFKDSLSIYLEYYVENVSIKIMTQRFMNYIIKSGKKRYLGKGINGEYITQKNDNENLPEATDIDIVNHTIKTIKDWIENKFMAHLYNVSWQLMKLNKDVISNDIINSITYFSEDPLDIKILDLGIDRQFIPEIKKEILKRNNLDISTLNIIEYLSNNLEKESNLYNYLLITNHITKD